MLDSLGLENTCLLCLHALYGMVCSSHLESTLTGPEWKLHPDQSTVLAVALLKDIYGSQDYIINVVNVYQYHKFWKHLDPVLQKHASFFMLILQGLGVVAVLCMMKITWFGERTLRAG